MEINIYAYFDQHIKTESRILEMLDMVNVLEPV